MEGCLLKYLYSWELNSSVQFSSVAQSCLTLCSPMAAEAFLSITNSRSMLKLMSIEVVMAPNYLILCRPPPPTLNLSQLAVRIR